MNISKLDKAEVLVALYNNARPQGMGYLHYTPEDMTVEEARKILANFEEQGQQSYFDYLKGRVMKIDLRGDDLFTALYNRDNGEGAAEQALEHNITGITFYQMVQRSTTGPQLNAGWLMVIYLRARRKNS